MTNENKFNEFPEEKNNFKLENVLSTLISLIRSNLSMNNAGFVTTNLIVPALKSSYKFNQIHVELSKYQVYLVALPLEVFSTSFKIALPDEVKPKSDLTHVIWVCMKGEQEYNQLLKEHGLSKELNSELLEWNTGFLSR